MGLKLNAQKCDENEYTKRRQSNDRKSESEDFEEFVYLGATVTKEGGGECDMGSLCI